MTNNTIGCYGANYQVRDGDAATILHALGRTWETCVADSVAQEAANLYYRIKGTFVTEYYRRERI